MEGQSQQASRLTQGLQSVALTHIDFIPGPRHVLIHTSAVSEMF